MAKKAKSSGVKRERKALKKRSERKQKRKTARRMKAEAVSARNPRRVLRGARRLPTIGAWAQSGWQDGVVARVAVAREMSADAVLFVEYMVDIRCLGVRDSRGYTGVPMGEFEVAVLPRLYSPDPPLEISNELANEIIWGAVEYAESLGFPPHRSFRGTQFAIEPADALPRAAGLEFGYEGKPLYMPLPFDPRDEAADVKTLIDAVGLGNFIYQTPDGEIPDEVAEILGEALAKSELLAESGLLAEEPHLWTPGDVDEASGLWVPDTGEFADADDDDDAGGESGRSSESPALWTPGRD